LLQSFQNLTRINQLPEPLETVREIAKTFRSISIAAPDATASRIAALEQEIAKLKEQIEAANEKAEPETLFFGLLKKDKFQDTASEEAVKLLFRWIPLGISTGAGFTLAYGPDYLAQLIAQFSNAAPVAAPPPTLPPVSKV